MKRRREEDKDEGKSDSLAIHATILFMVVASRGYLEGDLVHCRQKSEL